MTRSLIWKEWREQSWKLAFGAVILMALTAVGLRARLVYDSQIMALAGCVGALVLPILVSMGVVATDRAEGALGTLLALPIPSWRVLACKLAIGAVACVAPMLGAWLVAWLIAAGREISGRDIAAIYLLYTASGLMLLFWTLALGVRQSTEARVALVGIGFLLVGAAPLMLPWLVYWWRPAAWLWTVHPLGLWQSWIVYPLLDVEPFRNLPEHGAALTATVLVAQIPLAALLLAVTAFRFARLQGAKP